MKSTVSPKGQITLPVEVRKESSDEHPVDQVFGGLRLERPVDTLLEEMRGPGDLFLKVFGPSRGADLELPPREPHEPIDLE